MADNIVCYQINHCSEAVVCGQACFRLNACASRACGAHRERRLVSVDQRRGSRPTSWFPDRSLRREPNPQAQQLPAFETSSARARSCACQISIEASNRQQYTQGKAAAWNAVLAPKACCMYPLIYHEAPCHTSSASRKPPTNQGPKP